MTSRLFVVTGCARTRLGYSSRVLTALGAPCGHEGVFSIEAFEGSPTLVWPKQTAGDASWLAAPVLGKLPANSVVLHQVRHPLVTIGELYRSRFFERTMPRRNFVQDFLPETRLGGPLVRCMRFWLQWNQMIEATEDYDDLIYSRIRIEDLSPNLACETLALMGLTRDRSSAQAVLTKFSNHGLAERKPTLSWRDLPSGQLFDEIVNMSERYGYRPAAQRTA